VLIYDGDCGFCTTSARWVEERLPLGYPVVAWQSVPDLADLGLTERQVQTAAWWIDVDGTPHRGARAIARALIAMKGRWSLVGRALLVPPVNWLADLGYALVARNRYRLPGATDACRVPLDAPAAASGADAARPAEAAPVS
jgi:predicted DCC family thiol-disulfide oxidoreductase YuxK